MKKSLALLAALAILFSLAGCRGAGSSPTSGAASVPDGTGEEILSFALTWGVYGISSYDSATGRLVKTKDATHPEDYVTACTLPAGTMDEIRALLASLDADSYPDEYNPMGSLLASIPSMTLILTVRTDGGEKTVRAENVSLSFHSDNAKGRKFLDVCRTISGILTETEEWKALPDYEFFYQ